jgi:hypothetical protein
MSEQTPEGGNGKLVPLEVLITVDPQTGKAGLKSNLKDKHMIINLLTTGINIINNAKDEEQSSIIVPQSRIKI